MSDNGQNCVYKKSVLAVWVFFGGEINWLAKIHVGHAGLPDEFWISGFSFDWCLLAIEKKL